MMRFAEMCARSAIRMRTVGDITIFHFALPSPMTQAFTTLGGTRVLQYHNITPAAFFAPYDPGLFRLAAIGRQELQSLVGHVDLALGDSEFNRQELEDLGFEPTGVMPIAVNTERITSAPRRPALEKILAMASSTSCLSDASSRTNGSRITSGWRRPTSATSIITIALSSSAAMTDSRATTRRCGP
jgi:hypothetical protein